MLTKKYIQKELALRIKGIRPNVTTNTDVLIGELKSALIMVDCLPDDEPEKKYNEAMLRADEAVQKGCLDKDMFDIIFPPEEGEDERIRECIGMALTDVDEQRFKDFGTTLKDCLAWLEKQKEQKPNIEICPHSIKSKSYSENPITPEMVDKAAEQCTWNQCDDNRFWIIDRAKKDILAKTNIESSPEEMKVLDSFLFRCWQMGWLGKYDVIVPEQKPVEISDFKTKLAEYLQNNSPKDGQYVISSESILEIAKEELIKRGELQKPVVCDEDKNLIEKFYAEIERLRELNASKEDDSETDEIAGQGYDDCLDDMENFLIKIQDLTPFGLKEECKDCQFNYAGKCKGYCSLKRKQKPAWIEEDDKMRNLAPEVTDEEIEEMVTKRSRSSGTTKSEMAFYRNGIKDAIKRFGLRPSWKPTKEQMEALRNAFHKLANTDVADSVRLSIMYDNLKKL